MLTDLTFGQQFAFAALSLAAILAIAAVGSASRQPEYGFIARRQSDWRAFTIIVALTLVICTAFAVRPLLPHINFG